MPKKELVCPKCRKKCGNAGAMAEHMKSHDREVESPSLLRFLKRAPMKKVPIELKPVSRKVKQTKLSVQARTKPKQKKIFPKLRPQPRTKLQPKPRFNPPPPRCPRTKSIPDTSPFIAPPNLTSANLDKRSPEFRIAHVRYYNKLKNEAIPILDRALYYEANKEVLGVKLRRFQQWFVQYSADKVKIEESGA